MKSIKSGKKLIYILNQYSSAEASHFYHILFLLEEISKNDVEIVLIIEKAKSIPVFKIPNVKVIAQEKKGILRFFELFYILKKLNKSGFKKTFVRISQNGALPAILVSKFYGGIVYYWHSGKSHLLEKEMPFNLLKIKWYIKSKLPFKLVSRYVSFFVTGPESMLEYYKETVGVNGKKLMCLYNDINVERFSPVDIEKKKQLKKELGVDINIKIILFVHRLSPVRKSLYYMPYVLENVLSNTSEYKCYVIGGGSELVELKNKLISKKLDDKVIILGEKPNSEIQNYYKISDVFINPTFTEGFPRVLLEAMASGLPCVTTNAGGTADIIGELQKEFMVDINNREKFSEKLTELISSDDIRKKITQENIESVKKFSTKNVAKMYVKNIFKNE